MARQNQNRQDELRNYINEQLKAILEQGAPDMELDPAFDERSLAIQEALEASRGKLFELDPETQAQLEAIRQNQLGQYQIGAQEREAELARTLYGRGIDQSSVGNRLGSDLLTNEALLTNQIEADAAGRSLGLRQALGQENLQNLGMQQGILGDDRAAALNLLGLQQQGYLGELGNLSGMATSFDQALRQLQGARAAANATRYSADQGRIASMYGADQALAGTRAMAAANRYGSDQSLRAALAHAGASRYGHDVARQGNRLNFKMGNRELRQRGDHFGRDLAFRYHDANQNYDLGQQRIQADIQLGRMAQPSTTDRIFGLLGAGLGTLSFGFGGSDERLKVEIARIDEALEKVQSLRAVTWKWFDPEGPYGGGIIAQDLEKVLPTAVESAAGYKTVDYHAVIGLLVGAVQELAGRVHELEEEKELVSV